ncbi:MAG TPA: methylmalonyl-CoA mutase family protein [Thermoanaerobaculaceae bacterium]|nr:methylmalonyl-CoA mutase family protein [Thermoanaerobaculaceae bacterium]HRS15068.1 methylmalonyl-CoA mutase family protein [Thermoanaerobaculaceae bacterium]
MGDQGQNTCIFSTEFALRMMGDVQQYFVDKGVRNSYSVSISGYHIAEAGANPIHQLAFTLANGFTCLEHYRHRGMAVDEYAPSLSFFFSNGMDAEYAVIGRVARRIWAVALQRLYGASPTSRPATPRVRRPPSPASRRSPSPAATSSRSCSRP